MKRHLPKHMKNWVVKCTRQVKESQQTNKQRWKKFKCDTKKVWRLQKKNAFYIDDKMPSLRGMWCNMNQSKFTAPMKNLCYLWWFVSLKICSQLLFPRLSTRTIPVLNSKDHCFLTFALLPMRKVEQTSLGSIFSDEWSWQWRRWKTSDDELTMIPLIPTQLSGAIDHNLSTRIFSVNSSSSRQQSVPLLCNPTSL